MSSPEAQPRFNSQVEPEASTSTLSESRVELDAAAAERERAFNEERIQRRLAGEYERAGRRLSEVVSKYFKKFMRVC